MVIMEGIRKKYYILLAFLALLMCAFCIFIPISSVNRVETIYREYTREKIFDIKKTFLKDSVNNIIKSIESTQVEVMQKYEQRAKRLAIRFEGTIQAYPEEFVNFAKLSFSDPYNREVFTILILDKQTNEIIYKNLLPDFDQKDDIGNLIELLKEKSIGYHEIQNEEYCLIFMVLEEVIHRETKEDIKGRIHEDEFSNGSYFWVNEVLDYNGGENYAIRLIHPNLIDTEGMYLSTSMTDIKGNTPYLTELQGVVTEGEIFFNYYFEKKDSDEVSEKLTYAKLYEKYNWIIAMGVHLDDIQLYSDEIMENSDRVIRDMIFSIVLLVIALFTIAGLYLVLLERWYSQKSHKKFNEELNIDALTKAYNRRAAMIDLAKSFKFYKKYKVIKAIIFLDIDDFKKINDRYGHDQGDIVLQKIVEVIQNNIRNTDALYRWGGEEFLLICDGLRPENAMRFAKKILEQIKQVEYQVEDEKYKVTISMGISYFSPEDMDYNEVIKRADMALYEAKRNGKNQAILNIERAKE